MFLKEITKKKLEEVIGKSIADISSMSYDEEIAYVTNKRGNPPAFSKKIHKGSIGRGNPLIARRRLCTMDDIDSRILAL